MSSHLLAPVLGLNASELPAAIQPLHWHISRQQDPPYEPPQQDCRCGQDALQGHTLCKLTEHLHAQAEIEVRGLESGASQDVTGQVHEASRLLDFCVCTTHSICHNVFIPYGLCIMAQICRSCLSCLWWKDKLQSRQACFHAPEINSMSTC